MKKLNAFVLPSLLLSAVIFAALPRGVAAQDEADPPGRVGRLNYIQGSVSYQVSGDQDWIQADPNRPLTTGDNLWVDKDSRAEVHIGSTAIRMASETGLSILNLDDRTAQLQLPQGTIEVHLRDHQAGDAFEIDTPNAALTLTSSGEFLVGTDPNGGSTLVTVREGAAQVTGGGESYSLIAGGQYSITGTDQLAIDTQAAPGFDDFEDWCQSRDQRENDAISARYVSRDVDGYYDLDEYGDWRSDPSYGMVWVPRGVAAGWAPYHSGHWVWVAPWGWTWVDSEPWGFAPFHYGRWALVGGGWAWVPGPIVVRPVYAPALVGFVGGRGFGVSVAFGGGFSGVAWFPLGPRDVFVPGYRCSPRYVQNINVTNTRIVNVTQVTNVYNNYTRNVNVTNNYTYARTTTAVTAVSKETFVNARPVGTSVVRVSAEQIRNARAVGPASLQPTRSSYAPASTKITAAKPTVPFSQRQTVARLNPGASVNARRTPVYTNDSQVFNHPAAARPSAAQPPAATNNTKQPSRSGFRQFQPPPRESSAVVAQPARNNNATDRSVVQRQTERPTTMRYAPPVRAKDTMYDVHPPLNRNIQRPAPRQEEPRAQPQPRPQPEPRQQSEPREQPRQNERPR